MEKPNESSMERGSNPSLKRSIFVREREAALERGDGSVMTVSGAVAKTGVLFAILLAGGIYAWFSTNVSRGDFPSGLAIFPVIALIIALITCFIPRVSPLTTPIYALMEGLLLGTLSKFFESAYSGIVLEAVALSVIIFTITLVLFMTRLVKVTEKFKSVIAIATTGIALFYLIRLLFGLPILNDGGMYSILFSVFVVVIAALNFLVDFDFIEKATAEGAPKYMEWYSGFGILVTFIWLYLEILRLLAKSRK